MENRDTEKIESYVTRHRQVRRRRGTVGLLSVFTAVVVFLSLMLPAFSQDGGNPSLSAETASAKPGETITVTVGATAEDSERVFLLTAKEGNAALAEKYTFDSDSNCADVTDTVGNTVTLHRIYTDSGAAEYWFALPAGQTSELKLDFVSATAASAALRGVSAPALADAQTMLADDAVGSTLALTWADETATAAATSEDTADAAADASADTAEATAEPATTAETTAASTPSPDETELAQACMQATIYADADCTALSDDTTVITVTGMMPAGAAVRAVPFSVTLSDEPALWAYNITVMKADGTLWEPEADNTMTVSVQLPTDQQPSLQDGQSVDVYYVPDAGDPQLLTSQTAEDTGATSFDTGHFSVYAAQAVLAATNTTLSAGKYGNYTLSYNSTKDAFTTEQEYQQYIVSNSPLGVSGSFHIVAFDTANLNTHCNGNVLANNLYANSNFGTNNLTPELSYVVNYKHVNGVSESSENNTLVIGSSNTVTTKDNEKALAVNGTKIDKPQNIIQDSDSGTAPFIDLSEVKAQIETLSAHLAAQIDVGITKSTEDQNDMSLTLNNPTGAGYISLTPEDLNSMGGNAHKLKMMGFQTGCDGTIIVNVNCSDFGGSTITLPNATVWIDGTEQSTNEVTVFNAGKVIWNFTNAGGKTINTNLMTGMVIAPGATVNITQNLNGTIVADNVNVNAESHRTDFTGTIVPTGSAVLNASKTIDGKTAGNEAFEFYLDEHTGGGWQTVQDKTQSYGAVTFDPISYTEKGTYWYCICEKTSGYSDNTLNTGYNFSDAAYIVKVEVTQSGNTLQPTITYYSLNTGQTLNDVFSGDTVNETVLSQAGSAAFNNTTSASGYTLPSTGGTGTLPIRLLGMAIMLVPAAAVLAGRRWKKRGGGSSRP